MTQVNTYQRAPLAGDEAQYHDFVNGVFQAILTNSAGPTEPAETYPLMTWLDTSVAPPVLRRRNAANGAWDVAIAALSEAQAIDAASTVLGLVSGQRLAQAVAAHPPTTGDILGAIAGADYNDVGSYVFAKAEVDVLPGDTIAGGDILATSARWSQPFAGGDFSFQTSGGLSGTWRCMGRLDSLVRDSISGTNRDVAKGATLFLRIV